MRHVFPHAVDPAHVPRTGLVIDDAGGHEQRGLECGVVDDMEHRRHGSNARIKAEEQRNEAQVTDGRVGQQPLEVVLEQCHHGADQQGRQPRQADHVEPPLRLRQGRVQAGQQEYAGLDHRRRVQERRHWRRRGHRLWQPEVEGKLRRLGEHAEQDEHQRQWIQRVRADLIACRDHLAQFEAADDMAKQQNAGQERQPSSAGDGQCHPSTAPGVGAMVPVANQQERRKAGQLPEHQHQQQVLGKHHAQHRAHEQQKEAEEASHRVFLRQVIARVENHQQADAKNQQGEQKAQAIEA